ncbi:hypothetical protein Scep_017712 [Stephania cephalantha]|uniref:Glycosyltransferase n=1 Tax=Stephania cephalantha TaxID=152367 RepID=A0AAP0NV70_9MAGN
MVVMRRESSVLEQQQEHVVVIPYPGQGHINPLLQFAKRLASKGLKATMGTTPYAIKSITAHNVGVELISDGFDQGGFAEASSVQAYLESFETAGSRTLTELIKKYEDTECPITCVVYDSFLVWALDVAKQNRVCSAAFFTNSAAICSIFCYIHHGMLKLPIETEDLPVKIGSVAELCRHDLPTFLTTPGAYPAYLTMKVNQYNNLSKTDWILCNSFQALEDKEVKAVAELWPAKLIGPMIPSSYLDGRIKGDEGYGASLWKPLSEQCLNWLESKVCKSVIYVSFGSMVSLSIKQMEEVAWGLKNCGWSFMWVVRESEQSKLPNDFLDSIQEDKGLVVSWCNQLEVLAHESIGCFVTHCGWNSTTEGLGLGVPMVGMPVWADQSTNAKYIQDVWRVGVRAKEDESGVVGREEVERCVGEVMEGERSEEIRRNARKLRKLSREAMSEGGTSDKNIDEFVEQLKLMQH